MQTPSSRKNKDKISIGLGLGGSASKAKKTRGRSGFSRPALQINTAEDLDFGSPKIGEGMDSPQKMVQPL